MDFRKSSCHFGSNKFIKTNAFFHYLLFLWFQAGQAKSCNVSWPLICLSNKTAWTLAQIFGGSDKCAKRDMSLKIDFVCFNHFATLCHCQKHAWSRFFHVMLFLSILVLSSTAEPIQSAFPGFCSLPRYNCIIGKTRNHALN